MKKEYLNRVLRKIEYMDDKELKGYIKEYRENLEKYQKILNKQYKCLYQIEATLIKSEPTLGNVIIGAIEKQKSDYLKYFQHTCITMNSYKNTDSDTIKKFYSLDYGLFD